MNAKMIKQIQDDYREILSSNAGKRVLGGIFHTGRLRSIGLETEYSRGMRDLAVKVANTLYEASPYGVIECLMAYEDFLKENADDERRIDAEPYDYSGE